MKHPTPDHIEGFFHGMRHALEIAQKNKTGQTSKQAQAILTEIMTLTLLQNFGGRNA